jgi:hypothetical protein
LEWEPEVLPETVFMTRVFFEYCDKHSDDGLKKRVSDASPTMSQMASFIEAKYAQLKDGDEAVSPVAGCGVTRADYVLCEVVKIAALLDSFDYQGCKKMRQVICASSLSPIVVVLGSSTLLVTVCSYGAC